MEVFEQSLAAIDDGTAAKAQFPSDGPGANVWGQADGPGTRSSNRVRDGDEDQFEEDEDDLEEEALVNGKRVRRERVRSNVSLPKDSVQVLKGFWTCCFFLYLK